MEFLQETGDRGYPTEYLLSRIRGRRVFLFREWEDVEAGTDSSLHFVPAHYRDFIAQYSIEGIWKRYLKEVRWVYFQMNRTVRDIFYPYFIFSELDTLMVCLRYSIGAGNKAEIEGLLSLGLLSEKIKHVLRSDAVIPHVLEILRKKIPFLSTDPPGLSGKAAKNGLAGVERWITSSLIDYITGLPLHPVLQRYFSLIIDARNILTLYKYLTWEIPSAPVLFKGGSMPQAVLQRIGHSRDISRLEELIYKKTGLSGIEGKMSAGIEVLLYRDITKRLKKMERECDMGFILGYLWRFSREARNFTILSYGSTVERDALKEELVY